METQARPEPSEESGTALRGPIVVAPHHFPDLEREEALAAEFGVQLVATPDVDAFRAAVVDAAIVMITPYAQLTADDFARMRRCGAVVRYGIGYDNIDVVAAATAGIPVSIVPDASSEEVASHAVAMGMSLSRRLPSGDAAIREGRWAGTIGYDAPPISAMAVGIIGMGRIGQIAARLWSALGSTVIAYDPFVEISGFRSGDLKEVLSGSDVVSLHLPLSKQTRGLISANEIRQMKPEAILINVSRGGLVDENALADALLAGQLGGAGVDAFSTEPLPAEHRLRTTPNTVLTPHIGWRSARATGALQAGAVERARLALTGKPLIDTVA